MSGIEIKVEANRESTYRFLKQNMIDDLTRDLRDRKLSKAYKKSAARYAIREIADYNEVLGLPATDGVKEEWHKI